jgi:hypothetical protein
MFGMKAKPNSGALAKRVRQISETQAAVPAGPADPVANKREPRAPSFKPGKLTFITGERMDVVVTNISPRGARVEFVRNTRIPDCVMLTEPMSGSRKWAYVSWQTWGMAGLEFVGRDAGGSAHCPPRDNEEF